MILLQECSNEGCKVMLFTTGVMHYIDVDSDQCPPGAPGNYPGNSPFWGLIHPAIGQDMGNLENATHQCSIKHIINWCEMISWWSRLIGTHGATIVTAYWLTDRLDDCTQLTDMTDWPVLTWDDDRHHLSDSETDTPLLPLFMAFWG